MHINEVGWLSTPFTYVTLSNRVSGSWPMGGPWVRQTVRRALWLDRKSEVDGG